MILFVTDLGKNIGLGHLRRCISLADELIEAGEEIVFLVNDDPLANEISGSLLTGAYSKVDFSTAQNASRLIADQCLLLRATTLFIDSYRLKHDQIIKLLEDTPGKPMVVVFDDYGHDFLGADILLRPGFPSLKNGRGVKKNTGKQLILSGPEYALLRREFKGLPKRTVRKISNDLLITLGGGATPMGIPGK